MKKIGLLSDTHSYFEPKLYEFFAEVDEIWHAGDIGSDEVLNELEQFKTVRAVYGNMDMTSLRYKIKETERFVCEGVDVCMTHIEAGNPDKHEFSTNNPDKLKLFVCGHTHILKIFRDKKLNLLHINPGAAGKTGPHSVQTAVRFVLDNGEIKDMEVFEKQFRGNY